MNEKTEPRPGLLDLGLGLGLAGLGIYFAFASWRLPAGPDPSAPGPGAAPGILGAALALFGAYLALKVLWDMRKTISSNRDYAAETPSADKPQHALSFRDRLGKPVIAILLLTASALLLESMGFMLSTFLFLVAGFVWLGDAKWKPSVSAAAITSVSLWLFFTKLLGVGLPFGRLVEILFY